MSYLNQHYVIVDQDGWVEATRFIGAPLELHKDMLCGEHDRAYPADRAHDLIGTHRVINGVIHRARTFVDGKSVDIEPIPDGNP